MNTEHEVDSAAAQAGWDRAVAKVTAEQNLRQANQQRAMAACGRGSVAESAPGAGLSASWAKVVARFKAQMAPRAIGG